MAVVYSATQYAGQFQRAADGVNFSPFPLLAAEYLNAPASPQQMVFGPGYRLFWNEGAGVLRQCNGETISTVTGGPTMEQIYRILYDPDTGRLYVAYFDTVALDYFRVAYWNGTAWTTLGTTFASATGSGALGIIPAGAHAGQIIVGWQNDSRFPGTRNVIQRWDGAAWQDELFTANTLNTFNSFCTYGTSTIALLSQSNAVASPLVQERSSGGVWTDITPAGLAYPGTMRAGVEYQGDLYVAYRDPSYSRVEIWKRSGGVWSLDLDLIAEGTGILTAPLSLTVVGDILYVGLEAYGAGFEVNYFLVKRNGAWERVPITGDASFFVASPELTITPPNGNASAEFGPTLTVIGAWTGEIFRAWDPALTWQFADGVWAPTTPSYVAGTRVYFGKSGGYARPPLPDGYFYGNSAIPPVAPLVPTRYFFSTGYEAGNIDVLDPYVLTCSPPNGYGLVDCFTDNGVGFEPFHFLPDSYTFDMPEMTSILAISGSINGGNTITVTGTNFFSNQYPYTTYRAWRTNRFFVRTASGRWVEADYTSVVFISETQMTFVIPPFPGGTNPVVEVVFRPAGLPIFGQGGAVPQFVYPKTYATYTYTGLAAGADLAILGSIDTVIGLGGYGGDVIGPDADNNVPIQPIALECAGGGMNGPVGTLDGHGCVEC